MKFSAQKRIDTNNKKFSYLDKRPPPKKMYKKEKYEIKGKKRRWLQMIRKSVTWIKGKKGRQRLKENETLVTH